jgi:ectoine hydroxylase-related dioxygenase (phytanoyl-CoA dioxygenase family)
MVIARRGCKNCVLEQVLQRKGAVPMDSLADRIAPLCERFRRDGFAVVPGLLTPEELDRFGRAVDEAVARRKRFDSRGLAEKSLYEQSFIQCTNLWEDSPGVLPLTFHPLIAETAARLLGIERIRLWHDQALYKEPGGRLTDPHQDQPYWPLHETDTITAWIPFDGSTHQNGCMGYVPGSHAIGLRRFVNIFRPENALDILKLPEIRDTPPVFVEVPRGAVAFHRGLTVHTAKPNLTARVRRVHTMIYFRDGSTRGRDFFHPSVDRPGIRIGEAVASDLTPIVWPRPTGDLPRPPRIPLTEAMGAYAKAGVFPEPEK